MADPQYLLIQIRNPDDPIRLQEITCFAKSIGCHESQLIPWNLLSENCPDAQISHSAAIFIGGSGHYSAVGEAAWLDRGLEALSNLVDNGRPIFASCWGFQALARALGGVVIHDLAHAELGTFPVHLTDLGKSDPLFGKLPHQFPALMGHEDCVIQLPSEAQLLASSTTVANQAFRLNDKPIYATQFHPELDCESYLQRVRAYPEYVTKIRGMEYETFSSECRDTPECRSLIREFVKMFVEG